MGSVLRLGKEVIWPGSALSLAAPYKKMKELLREDLFASDVFRTFGFFDVYSSLLSDLAACGFDETSDPPTLYTHPYDWRKSNTLAAGGLTALLDAVVKAHGAGVEISIVAHSMGGLVSRYVLESGLYEKAPGVAAVRRLITIGTPHRGAPLALTAAMGLEKRLFLSASQVLQVASDPRYTALYELLPMRGEPFAWDTEDVEYAPVDVYDLKKATGAGGMGLIAANLKAAETFRAGLDFGRRPAHVRYFSFYGTNQKTPALVYLAPGGGAIRARSHVLDNAGDGTVPVWSGQPNGLQSLPAPGEHSKLFRSSDLRRTLAVLLGAPGTLAALLPIEISVSPKVVEPGGAVDVALIFPPGATEVDGTLRFVRITADEDGNELSAIDVGDPVTVRYSGGEVKTISVALTAPELSGFYRVTFASDGDETSDKVVVQETPAGE